MKIISLVVISLLFIINVSYAKTLVKYQKTTGDIIQTNIVDEMPSDTILNDRYRSEDTDVILVDDSVDISTQKVDLNKKKIKDISKTELDNKKKIDNEKQAEEKLIQERMRKLAIDELKKEGAIFKYN